MSCAALYLYVCAENVFVSFFVRLKCFDRLSIVFFYPPGLFQQMILSLMNGLNSLARHKSSPNRFDGNEDFESNYRCNEAANYRGHSMFKPSCEVYVSSTQHGLTSPALSGSHEAELYP